MRSLTEDANFEKNSSMEAMNYRNSLIEAAGFGRNCLTEVVSAVMHETGSWMSYPMYNMG